MPEIKGGRYPPRIYYEVRYTSAAEQRQAPAFWTAELHGANGNLFFNCDITQELGTYLHAYPM